ncbi:unnamed protein product [Rangifer tarandus platyrhynchus]|uniref:Uncharacterized protein n=1 Tax=Rangifer tarandus platyrhynchus TaxID=3082113 RepID=A0AC59Z011_RANTA
MQNRWPALREGSHESALRSSECKVQLAVPWRPGVAGSLSELSASWAGAVLRLQLGSGPAALGQTGGWRQRGACLGTENRVTGTPSLVLLKLTSAHGLSRSTLRSGLLSQRDPHIRRSSLPGLRSS